MNVQTNSNNFAGEIFKQGMVLVVAIGLGILSTSFSPLYALGVTLMFSALSFFLYFNSFHSSQNETSLSISLEEGSRKSLLFKLFYLSFFLSITIPKAGRTISNIPITVANVCIGITLVLWALHAIFSQKVRTKIPLFRAIIIFMFYGFFASILGIVKGFNYKFVVLDFVVFMGFIPVYFLVCSVVKTKKQVQMIITAVILGMILVSLYGILQSRLGFETIAVPGLTKQYNMAVYEGLGKWNVIEGGGQKVYSTFQNGNVFGNHLALFIPLLAGCLLAFSTFSIRWKIFLTGTFFIACYTLLITYSRGALVSTVGGIMFLAFLARKIRLKVVIVGLILASIVFAFMNYYGEQPELTRYDFSRIKEDPDRFTAGRLFRIKFVLEQFALYSFTEKFFGRGFGSGLIEGQGCNYTDNLYLTLLFKFGIIGVFLLLRVFFLFFHSLLRLYSTSHDEQFKGVLAGGAAGMFAALIHYLVDALWLFPPLAANFWFLGGIAMMAGVLSQADVVKKQENVFAKCTS